MIGGLIQEAGGKVGSGSLILEVDTSAITSIVTLSAMRSSSIASRNCRCHRGTAVMLRNARKSDAV